MKIDLTPLYANTVGFDRFGSLLDAAMSTDRQSAGYPPYDIELVGENRYAITLAVAGFQESDIDVQIEKGVLTVRGPTRGASEGFALPAPRHRHALLRAQVQPRRPRRGERRPSRQRPAQHRPRQGDPRGDEAAQDPGRGGSPERTARDRGHDRRRGRVPRGELTAGSVVTGHALVP